MENQAGWHGKVPNREELDKALKELGLSQRIPVEQLLDTARRYQAEVERNLDAKMPKFSRDYWWNARRHHEGQDGAYSQGLRPVTGGERRR